MKVFVLAWLPALPFTAASDLYVSARGGSDASGDGSSERPFRSVTCALAEWSPEVPAIHVDAGTYDADSGEVFPLVLPSGMRLQGLAPETTLFDGAASGAVFRISDACSVLISDLSIANAGIGIDCGSASAASLVLHNVALTELRTGVLLGAGSKPDSAAATMTAKTLRMERCETGFHVAGDGAVELSLSASLFANCTIGLLLDGATTEQKGVHHRLLVEDCRFVGNRKSGILRRGSDGLNRAKDPYRVLQCEFMHNLVGLEFELPAADSPIEVQHCTFLNNEQFGLKVTGASGDAAKISRIEDCAFRFNGVGLQLISTQVLFEVRRNRVENNLGSGVFLANFLATPNRVVLTDNLVAHNGAAGVYFLSDGRALQVACVNNTIVGNSGSGIRRHDKHGGKSGCEIRNCILWGNGKELEKIEAEEVSFCLISTDELSGHESILREDPRFVNAELRNYELMADSPCVNRGIEAEGAIRAGLTDLLGRARRVGAINLGAFEVQAVR